MNTEQFVLGGMLLNQDAARDLSDRLEARMFTGRTEDIQHSLVFEKILENLDDGYNVISIYDQLGSSYGVLELAKNAALHGADIGLMRNAEALIVNSFEVEKNKITNSLARSKNVGQAAEELRNLTDKVENAILMPRIKSCLDNMPGMIERLKEKAKKGIFGLQTSIPMLNDLTGGLQRGNMTTIGARPGMGKSAMGIALAADCAEQDYKSLFVSTEMSEDTLVARAISSKSNIRCENLVIYPNRLQDDDYRQIEISSYYLKNMHVVQKTPITISQIRNLVREMKRKDGIDMLVVDYMQKISGVGQNMIERIGSVASGLKSIAVQFDIHVVALAQLNRDAENRELPVMGNLKGSGDIEQESDMILFLHRNEDEAEQCHWLICMKNRFGKLHDIPVVFEKTYQRIKQDRCVESRTLKKKRQYHDKGDL